MKDSPLVSELFLRNFLSYGGAGCSLHLLGLNVLIGPNASGKSNLIEALSFLRAAPTDLSAAVRGAGGVADIPYKGTALATPTTIHVALAGPVEAFGRPIIYDISFAPIRQRLEVIAEFIGRPGGKPVGGIRLLDEMYYTFDSGLPTIWQSVERNGVVEYLRRELNRKDIAVDQSILAQRKDPDLYPELSWIADRFNSIAVYREWTFGQRSPARAPQPADLPVDFLLPDSSNLALVINELQQRASTRKKILDYLRKFYASAQHIATRIHGGTVQLFIDEGMDDLVPATRLSDGTLRYLSLLAILCHPSPPPIVCIEEPELGLHPDILPTIAELLLDASQRTQLIVTTHSDALVSALSDTPECIVVCEPGENGTELRRLDREALSEWLSRYSLGELWRMGEIGGTRW